MTPSLLEAAIPLRPVLRAAAAGIEARRRLSPEVLDALQAMDAFHLQLTDDYGGHGADPITLLRVIEELARGDASSGWCAMVGSESSACLNAYLDPAVVRAMTAGTPRPVHALSAVGVGRAVETAGGYVVRGRWRFASACRHAQWLGGLAVVHAGDQPRQRDNGAPLLCVAYAPAHAARLIDTWTADGLKATASDDFEFDEVFVPAGHVADLFGPPRHASPVWRLPTGLRLALSKAAAVCGMARAALDATLPLLARTPFIGGRPAREEARVQIALAEAEATLEGGRALLYQRVQEAWDLVQRGEVLDLAAIARVRLAVVFAARQAVAAVAMLRQLAGSAAIFDETLARAARDLDVARHHFQLQPHIVEDVGRVMLGFAPRSPLF